MSRKITDRVIVLHTRPFQESSLIVDGFGLEYGRVGLLARGARSGRKSSRRAELQLGAEVDVELHGRGDLKTITDLSVVRSAKMLAGEAYAIACYISELTLRVLQPMSTSSSVYEALNESIINLDNANLMPIFLRKLELALLDELGETIDFEADSIGDAIEQETFYSYVPHQGFMRQSLGSNPATSHCFSGEQIVQIANGDWRDGAEKILQRICQMALREHIGHKPLRSRELWHQWKRRQLSVAAK